MAWLWLAVVENEMKAARTRLREGKERKGEGRGGRRRRWCIPRLQNYALFKSAESTYVRVTGIIFQYLAFADVGLSPSLLKVGSSARRELYHDGATQRTFESSLFSLLGRSLSLSLSHSISGIKSQTNWRDEFIHLARKMK